ncbi:MAG: FAD-dependent oxidoreductase [Roseobacter sp.]|nr:FAD-dependent oxidoreductase [Roseobacter sp.]
MSSKPKIAIIGAGITGVHLARQLMDMADVQVFEKSRGIGGRMSTRRADDCQFDHGAQYFTAHSAAFQAVLEPFVAAGVVARWTPRLACLGGGSSTPHWNAPRYVAVPGMNALCKAMAEGLSVSRQTRIGRIERSADGRWALTSEGGEACGRFDWVISTAPAEQSAKLMPGCFSETDTLAKTRMQGCYSLMLGGLDLGALTWDAAVVQDSPLAWLAVNNSKPGREGAPSLLCQTANTWAEAHLEEDADAVQDVLMNALYGICEVDGRQSSYISLHKWRFAKVEHPTGKPFLLDSDNRLAAAGDWCGVGRVEAGFESAEALAKKMRNVVIKQDYVSHM